MYHTQNVTQIHRFSLSAVGGMSLGSSVFGSCARIKCTWRFYRPFVFFFVSHRPQRLCAYSMICGVLIAIRFRSCRMRTIAQQQRWVCSPRIPLLFVSLALTVDHHNRLCIVFGIVFPLSSRVYSNRAHFYYRSMWILYIFFRSFFHFNHSNVSVRSLERIFLFLLSENKWKFEQNSNRMEF